MSHVTCHMSRVTCKLSRVTDHQCQQPQTKNIPLLTPALCIVGWFTNTELKNIKTNKIFKIIFFKGFLVLKFQKSPAFFFLVTNRGDKHMTHTQTDIANDRLNRPRGRFSESLNTVSFCWPIQ